MTRRKGQLLTEETKEKIAIAQRGKHPSQETRIKMSVAHTGVPLSEEHRQHISEGMKVSIEGATT